MYSVTVPKRHGLPGSTPGQPEHRRPLAEKRDSVQEPLQEVAAGSIPVGDTNPRAIADSDVACAGVPDSTPELQRLILAGAGEAGSIPAHNGSGGTPLVTAGAIPVAGAT